MLLSIPFFFYLRCEYYHNLKGWKTYPFYQYFGIYYPLFQIWLLLTPFSVYVRTSTVGKKQPFLLVFLYEHHIHLWIQVPSLPRDQYITDNLTFSQHEWACHRSLRVSFCRSLSPETNILKILLICLSYLWLNFLFTWINEGSNVQLTKMPFLITVNTQNRLRDLRKICCCIVLDLVFATPHFNIGFGISNLIMS